MSADILFFPNTPATPESEDSSTAIPNNSFLAMSARTREIVERRSALIREWQEMSTSLDHGDRTEAIKVFCREHGISCVTLYRWLTTLESEGVSGLAPRWGAKRGHSRLAPDRRDRLLAYYTDRDFPHRTKTMTFDFHRMECREAGDKPLSETRIRAILSEPRVRILKFAAIHGEREAEMRFGPFVRRTRRDSWPGQAYLSDHHQFDVPVIAKDRTRVVFLTYWEDDQVPSIFQNRGHQPTVGNPRGVSPVLNFMRRAARMKSAEG
jgi:hypothetical protein